MSAPNYPINRCSNKPLKMILVQKEKYKQVNSLKYSIFIRRLQAQISFNICRNNEHFEEYKVDPFPKCG